jgi:hypothetical protein
VARIAKDYDICIQYNPGKSNVVAYALSRKVVCPIADWLVANFEWMGVSYCFAGVANEENTIHPSIILDRVREAQQSD